MTKLALAPLTYAVAIALLAGCATPPERGPYLSKKTNENKAEDNAKFVLLDKTTQDTITCASFEENRLPDGRLQVSANVLNLKNKRAEVQAACTFKDSRGFSVEDTPFEAVFLDPHGQETVKFISANDKAYLYTIHVRKPH